MAIHTQSCTGDAGHTGFIRGSVTIGAVDAVVACMNLVGEVDRLYGFIASLITRLSEDSVLPDNSNTNDCDQDRNDF